MYKLKTRELKIMLKRTNSSILNVILINFLRTNYKNFFFINKIFKKFNEKDQKFKLFQYHFRNYFLKLILHSCLNNVETRIVGRPAEIRPVVDFSYANRRHAWQLNVSRLS